LVVVIAVGVLWLVGQGLGWFGSGFNGQKGDGTGLGSGATQADAADNGFPREPGTNPSNPHLQVVGPIDVEQSGGGTATGGAPEGGQSVGLNAPPVDPKLVGVGKNLRPDVDGEVPPQRQFNSGVSADRFASLVSLFESHLAAAELGSATATLQRVLKQPLSDAQRDRVAALEVRLLPVKKACEVRILALVQSGEVLAADSQAAQLVVGGVWQATELLAAAPKLAFASNWESSVDAKGAVVPAPTPLVRNRKVRVRFGDRLRTGVVANGSRDEVVVRLVSGGRQTFPTVKAVSCEPADSTASEAVEMGLAAVQAGAPRLARLWLLRAHLLNAELTMRGHQLLELLR
jgi:hypothetical protein